MVVGGFAAHRNPDSAVAMDAKIRIDRGTLMIDHVDWN
jgi:hypothetical protein